MNDLLPNPGRKTCAARRSGGLAQRWRVIAFGMLGLLGLLSLLPASPTSHTQSTRKVVYVIPIDGIIDLGLAPLVARILNDAAEAGAAAVILDINTFGERADAAVLIRDALPHAKVPTVAFVNKWAISAGALIALAAEKITIADGGTIGAATPVAMGASGAAPLPLATGYAASAGPTQTAFPVGEPGGRAPRDRLQDNSRPLPHAAALRFTLELD